MLKSVPKQELLSKLEFVDVECMGKLTGPDGIQWIALEDDDGIRVEVPSSQFTDNGLRLPDCGAAEIPALLHTYWFGRKLERLRAEISDNIHAHFQGLMRRKKEILDDPELYMAQPDWLSRETRFEKKGYAIGALIDAWDKGSILLADDGESCIIRLLQNDGLPEGIYEAWHPEKGLVVGFSTHNAWEKSRHLDELRSGCRHIRGLRRLEALALSAY